MFTIIVHFQYVRCNSTHNTNHIRIDVALDLKSAQAPISERLCFLGTCAYFLSSADFFLISTFSKTSFGSTIIVSNSLDPDQARRFVGPGLGPKLFAKVIGRRPE